MKKFLILSLLMALTLIWVPDSMATKIKAVKGKKVLIDSEGDQLKKGDIYKVKNKAGKTTGLVKVSRVAGKMAEGLLKGAAEKGAELELRKKKAKRTTPADVAKDSEPSSDEMKIALGAVIGFNRAQADITMPVSGDDVSLDGNGFSVKGLLDLPVFSIVWFRAMIGLEQFKVSGTNHVECGGDCSAEIDYLGADLWGRAVFSTGTFRPWLGAGFAVMFPLRKDTTALSEPSITNTSIFAGGGGFDLMLSDSSYIPVQVEYDLYPSSETVKANAIAGRLGFAKSF